MKKSRKDFLKISGLAGVSLAGVSVLPGCSTDSTEQTTSDINWQTDPEWQQVRYGEWGGPGVNPRPGLMDNILLKDYAPKSSVVVPETFIAKAKFPVIDTNIKNYPEQMKGITSDVLDEWVRTMDEVGVEKSVLRTGVTGDEFDRLVDKYLKPHPDRFLLFCGIEGTDIDSQDYPERTVNELVRCYEKGARGVGELTDKGLGLTGDPNIPRDERLHHDDERLDLFWNKCMELKIPVNIHVADHPSAWKPLDIFQERTPDYQHFNLHGKDILSMEDLLIRRDRLLANHPDTTFIACHLSNQGNDLEALSSAMNRFQNLYVDTSSRDYEIGRTPRAARKFLMKYSDRVLFGTDMGMQKSMYQAWWQLLESDDEYMTGRVWWPYYGLNLPESVLELLYRGNAKRLMNWENV